MKWGILRCVFFAVAIPVASARASGQRRGRAHRRTWRHHHHREAQGEYHRDSLYAIYTSADHALRYAGMLPPQELAHTRTGVPNARQNSPEIFVSCCLTHAVVAVVAVMGVDAFLRLALPRESQVVRRAQGRSAQRRTTPRLAAPVVIWTLLGTNESLVCLVSVKVVRSLEDSSKEVRDAAITALEQFYKHLGPSLLVKENELAFCCGGGRGFF